MKKSLLLIICLLVSCFAYSQGVITGPKKRTQATTTSSKPTKRIQTTTTRRQGTTSQPSNRFGPSSSFAVRSKTYSVNGVSFDMVEVEGGNFMMGADDSDAYDSEKPVHSEHVSTFCIGKTEVTQALWKAVMGSNPSYFQGDDLPVENVSWHDCQTFVDELNSLTGENFRLPTEAEWEYAARGGNRSCSYKYSGSDSLGTVAWYSDNSGKKTHPVATKTPNELGVYDMSGNVSEWVSDLWSRDYKSSRSGSDCTFRGGCWYNYAWFCRVSCRDYTAYASHYLGFRLAL